jgi:hypothetical protein
MSKTFLFVLLFFMFYDCNSQNIDPGNTIPFGLTSGQWTRAQRIWSSNNYPVVILLSDSTEVPGQMLWANDTVLVYWADQHSLMNPFQADSLVKEVDLRHVSKLLVKRHYESKLFESGLLWGFLTGTSYGIMFIVNGFEREYLLISLFIGTTSGGLWEAISSSKVNRRSDQKTFVNYKSLPEDAGKDYVFFPGNISGNKYVPAPGTLLNADLKKISFKDLVNLSPQVKKAFTTPKFSFEWLLPLYGDFNIYDHGYGLSAGYKLSERYSIGYRYLSNNEQAFGTYPGSNHDMYEFQRNRSHHIYVKYYPGSLNWLLTTPGFKAFVGADVSANKILYANEICVELAWPVLETEKNLLGAGLMAGFDFYPVRSLSLGMTAVQSFIKPFQTGEQTFIDYYTYKEVTLDGVTVRPSCFGIFFSLGFHF